MKGHIRKRGVSWEYIIDVGLAAAQRCSGCGRRFWVERKPKSACPKCGEKLTETEERRRTTQAGFASKKECQAAMAKVIGAIDEQRFVLPVRLTLREYLARIHRLTAEESGSREKTSGKRSVGLPKGAEEETAGGA